MDITENVAPEQTLNAPVVPAQPATEPEKLEVAEPETPEPDAEPQEDEASKALRRMERRIARLTAAKYETAAEANQARAEAEALRQRLAQYEQPQEPAQLRPEDVYTLAERIAQQKLEQEKVVSSIKHVLSTGRELEGFDQACNAVNEELPFYDGKGAPSPFLKVVLEAEKPAQVLHYLGSNPDVAADLVGLSPTQQARRIARIESQLSEPEAKPEPKVSRAPKPISPVKGTSRDDGTSLDPSLPVEEWARRFRASMSKRY